MPENKFDKEQIPVVPEYDLPGSFMVFASEKTYDIGKRQELWWQCPKCGGDISFDSIVEEFDESIGERQFITVYSWSCEVCSAQGSVHTTVNPMYISLEENEIDF